MKNLLLSVLFLLAAAGLRAAISEAQAARLGAEATFAETAGATRSVNFLR